MKGITFIGMAGAGKSAVGKIVAQILNRKFVDLDQLIVESQGITHHEYMLQNGEQALTQLEEQLTLGLNLSDIVFSPPGSMIYSAQAMEKIKNDSTVIYLQAEPSTIEKRLGDNLYKNGIVGLEEKGLKGVMDERIPFYEKYADYTFVSADQTAQEMAEKIIFDLNIKSSNVIL